MRHVVATRSGGKSAAAARTASTPSTYAPTSPSSTRSSANRTCTIARRNAASVPGTIGIHSSARSAVPVRRGSITTTLPPRARMPSSSPRMSAHARSEPCDACGFPPMMIQWSVRGTSGVGIDHMPPYISAAGEVLRPLIDGARGVDDGQRREPDEQADVAAQREVVGGRVADVAGDRVGPVRLDHAGEQLVAARERGRPSRPRPSGRRSRTIGTRTRSGSWWRWPSAVPFGQTYPFDHTSSRSPRMRSTVPSVTWISSPHIASHSGHVRKWVVELVTRTSPSCAEPEQPVGSSARPSGPRQDRVALAEGLLHALLVAHLDEALHVLGRRERRRDPSSRCRRRRARTASASMRVTGHRVVRRARPVGEAVLELERGRRIDRHDVPVPAVAVTLRARS